MVIALLKLVVVAAVAADQWNLLSLSCPKTVTVLGVYCYFRFTDEETDLEEAVPLTSPVQFLGRGHAVLMEVHWSRDPKASGAFHQCARGLCFIALIYSS